MRVRDNEHGRTAELRPKSDRIESEETGRLYRAAAAGRPDVAGLEGLLALQRVVGNGGTAATVQRNRSPVHDVINRPGQQLPGDLRQELSTKFHHNYDNVQLHIDDTSTRSVNAYAYASGNNMVFRSDKYDPSSQEGRRIIFEEAFHVKQQAEGPVEATPTGDGIAVSDPNDRHEREAKQRADEAVSAPTPAIASAPSVQTHAADRQPTPSVQLAADAMLVQRSEAGDGAVVQRDEGELGEEELAE